MTNDPKTRTHTSASGVEIQSSTEVFSGYLGSLALRELDNAFRLVPTLVEELEDPRFPELCEFSTADLFRLRLFSIALGFRNQIDVNVLTEDPAFVAAVLERRPTQFSNSLLPSQSTLSRFTEILSSPTNIQVLRESLLSFSRLANVTTDIESVTLDIDPFPIPAHGRQPGSAYNGYYRTTVFCPMLVSVAETNDFVFVALREGHNNSFGMAQEILSKSFAAVSAYKPVKLVRCDAGFYSADFLNAIRALGCDYVIRRKSAPYLDALVAPIIEECVKSITEKTTIALDVSLPKEHLEEGRRVILAIEIEDHCGKLIHFNHFFVETSYDKSVKPLDVVSIYRQRGTFEAQIGQFNQAIHPALTSSPRRDEETKRRRVEKALASKSEKLLKTKSAKKNTAKEDAPRSAQAERAYAMNEVTLILDVLARNLLNLLRDFVPNPSNEATPERPSLQTVQKNVLNVLGRLIKQGRNIVFRCAQESIELLTAVLNAIEQAALAMRPREERPRTKCPQTPG